MVSIIGYTDILLNGVSGRISEKQSRFVLSIRRQSEFLKTVANYLLQNLPAMNTNKIHSIVCPWQEDEFTPIASHDLRTPLTVIVGYTCMMLSGIGGNVSINQQDMLQLIKWHADELNALIVDLLDQTKSKIKGVR